MAVPLTDLESGLDISKEYTCMCFGHELINAEPRTVLTFFLTLLTLVFCFSLILVGGQSGIYLPVITALIGFWLPSPAQSGTSQSDAVQKTQLLHTNMRLVEAVSNRH